jgi:NOL1/NOP2/fmu family ribosome biogenesis protein
MVDITAKKAEVKGKGYKKWATLHNLKQMAATISIYEESGFSSPEELEAARDGLKAQKTEKARKNYREQHESEFIIAEAATRFLRQKESKSCQRPRPYKRRLSSL